MPQIDQNNYRHIISGDLYKCTQITYTDVYTLARLFFLGEDESKLLIC